MSLHYSGANGGCGLPGVEEITGRKCEKLAEGIAEKRPLSEGADKGKGIRVIFRMPKHGENDSIGMDTTKQRSGLWIHVIWSYGCGVMRFRRLGTFCAKISSQIGP